MGKRGGSDPKAGINTSTGSSGGGSEGSSSGGEGGAAPLQQPQPSGTSSAGSENLPSPKEETDEQVRAELEAFLVQDKSKSKKQSTKKPRVKVPKKNKVEVEQQSRGRPTGATTHPTQSTTTTIGNSTPRVAKTKRDFTQYPDLKKTMLLSNGKTVEQLAKETARCNYCNVPLAHDLTDIPKKERRTKRFKNSVVNALAEDKGNNSDDSSDTKDINGEEKSPWQRSPIVEHVFPKGQALEFGLEEGQGQVTPELWTNFIKDANGLKVACRSCNSEKQDKLISPTPGKNRWWPKMPGAGDELLKIYNAMKAKYGFKGQ